MKCDDLIHSYFSRSSDCNEHFPVMRDWLKSGGLAPPPIPEPRGVFGTSVPQHSVRSVDRQSVSRTTLLTSPGETGTHETSLRHTLAIGPSGRGVGYIARLSERPTLSLFIYQGERRKLNSPGRAAVRPSTELSRGLFVVVFVLTYFYFLGRFFVSLFGLVWFEAALCGRKGSLLYWQGS